MQIQSANSMFLICSAFTSTQTNRNPPHCTARRLRGARQLTLDGRGVAREAVLLFPPYHACVKDVGCGAGGAPRTLAVGPAA